MLAVSAVAHAQATVSVTLNDEGQRLAQRLQRSVSELIGQYEAKIDELYKISRIDALLASFGDTSAFAQRTLGVDYDIDAGDIVVGFTAAGVNGDVAIGTTNELIGGSIINYSVMGGMNLARFGQQRLSVFANGFYKTTAVRGLVGHLLTLGTHVQYQAIPARKRGAVMWTGLAVTSGLEFANLTMGTESSIESHFTAEGVNENITIHMSSTGQLDVLSRTYTVPLEVTSGVRFGGVFAIYAGGGLTVTGGNSTVSASLDGVLSYTANRIPVGTAHIEGQGEHGPNTLNAYALAGLAAHTRHVRVFVQGATGSGELGVNVGLRAAL
jgi:hypothetical protein